MGITALDAINTLSNVEIRSLPLLCVYRLKMYRPFSQTLIYCRHPGFGKNQRAPLVVPYNFQGVRGRVSDWLAKRTR